MSTLEQTVSSVALDRPQRADSSALSQKVPFEISRRGFIGAATAAFLPWSRAFAAESASGFSLQLGYAAITWGDAIEQSITDVADLGFRGIQLRANAQAKYGDKPEALKRLLDEKGVSLACFSSGNVGDAPKDKWESLLERHVTNARFVRALGGRFLQVTTSRPRDRAPNTEEFERTGAFLNELGRRTAEHGVRVALHNHMDSIDESPEEIARLLALTECRYVELLLDIAHYAQGGGDPVAAVKRHKDRIGILHLKDVRKVEPAKDAAAGAKTYQFVELGRGRVDVPGVIAALKAAEFRGPAVIELDAVPDAGRTAKECAETNKKYVTGTLGLSL